MEADSTILFIWWISSWRSALMEYNNELRWWTRCS